MNKTAKDIIDEKENAVIHSGSYWAGQTGIRLDCDKSFTPPAWRQPTLPPDIHSLEDGRFYTFEKKLVTCINCCKLLPEDL